MKIAFVVFVLMLSLVLQNCLTFRKTDRVAIRKFGKEGVVLTLHHAAIGDRTIHYACTGADSLPTIVFLHGSPGGRIEFEQFLDERSLFSQFRLISIDRPGFGYSNYGDALNLQQQADVIYAFLRQIANGRPLYLVGHSLGGPLAALLAADHPEKISGIVILAGALDPALEPREKWRPEFMKAPLKYLLPGATRQSNVELWYLKKDLVVLAEKLPYIICPVYVMHARNDMLVDVENVAYIKEHFTGAPVSITLFRKGNHFIHYNKQPEIDSLLLTLK